MQKPVVVFDKWLDTSANDVMPVCDKYCAEYLWAARENAIWNFRTISQEGEVYWHGWLVENEKGVEREILSGGIDVMPFQNDRDTPVRVIIKCSEAKHGEFWKKLGKTLAKDFDVLGPGSEDLSEEWNRIPDEGYDRELLKLWWSGCTAEVIGNRVGVSSRRVYNRLHELRKKHGSQVIPRSRDRRKTR